MQKINTQQGWIFMPLFSISILILFALIMLSSPKAYADLIPSGDNNFYYRIGGGQSVAIPAYDGAQSLPLRVEGDVGLGYNCGIFE